MTNKQKKIAKLLQLYEVIHIYINFTKLWYIYIFAYWSGHSNIDKHEWRNKFIASNYQIQLEFEMFYPFFLRILLHKPSAIQTHNLHLSLPGGFCAKSVRLQEVHLSTKEVWMSFTAIMSSRLDIYALQHATINKCICTMPNYYSASSTNI